MPQIYEESIRIYVQFLNQTMGYSGDDVLLTEHFLRSKEITEEEISATPGPLIINQEGHELYIFDALILEDHHHDATLIVLVGEDDITGDGKMIFSITRISMGFQENFFYNGHLRFLKEHELRLFKTIII